MSECEQVKTPNGKEPVCLSGLENMNIQASRDAEGYLVQPEEWDEAIASELASEEGIELNDTYWLMLNFMQGYYGEHNVAPDVRHLISHLAAEKQCSKKQAKSIVFDSFPYGYVRQACKIAGMKKPRAWSTG